MPKAGASLGSKTDQVVLDGIDVLLERQAFVEDNMIIALEAEELLLSPGVTTVDMASSTRDALRLIDAAPQARALLDVNLGSETSIAVARRLFELGIPYAFATGYGDGFCIPADLVAVPVVQKPYERADLLRAFPA